MQVRLAHAADLPALAKMRHALWPAGSIDEHRLELTVAVSRRELHALIAEDRDGAPFGFAELSVRPHANGCETGPVAFLEGIWVQEEYRRHGVGAALVSAAAEWANEKGYRELGSDCQFENAAAQAAHRRWGFEERERVVYFRRRLPDSASPAPLR